MESTFSPDAIRAREQLRSLTGEEPSIENLRFVLESQKGNNCYPTPVGFKSQRYYDAVARLKKKVNSRE